MDNCLYRNELLFVAFSDLKEAGKSPICLSNPGLEEYANQVIKTFEELTGEELLFIQDDDPYFQDISGSRNYTIIQCHDGQYFYPDPEHDHKIDRNRKKVIEISATNKVLAFTMSEKALLEAYEKDKKGRKRKQ